MLELESLSSVPSSSREALEERAIRAQKGQQQQLQKEANLNCPRCNSTNTKFCYYNNYSLSQPRYFCKTCRRYWTQGGSLRNVPVGGGSRKNKRTSSSSPSSSKKNIMMITNNHPNNLSTPPISGLIQSDPQNPSSVQGHDLNLAYDGNLPMLPQNPSFITSSELTLGNFMALTVPPPGSADPIGNVYSSGGLFSSLPELKPTLHYFSLGSDNNNGFGSGIAGNNNGESAPESANARSGDDDGDGLIYDQRDHNSRGQEDHSSSGYNWNNSGMFGGGGGSWQL
ncbi:hypothetical protein CDL15_Pgr023070 [Punica granatum]|nr:hypothetical protein CDL15_Pgr023070 [Punica granatum]PKI53881.1 hypothetical protein CRG98_025675 [Punica granatum]